jgi:hypothetical protein
MLDGLIRPQMSAHALGRCEVKKITIESYLFNLIIITQSRGLNGHYKQIIILQC